MDEEEDGWETFYATQRATAAPVGGALHPHDTFHSRTSPVKTEKES